MTDSENPKGNAANQASEIRSLARTLKVRANDLEFMHQIDNADIQALRLEMRSALASRHNAFKQSLLHAREQLPLFSRLRVNKLFQRGEKGGKS